MPLPIGTTLGPYEILAAIGAGGMGEVYRAADSRLHREVAIKVGAAEFTERAAREARLAASLNHPNICHIYDVGANYLVMELVEGPTLAERLKQGPMALDEALTIARQIAGALEAAHEKGIVHRDLKPANIKIRADGTVKVLDFGLAKSMAEVASEGDIEHSPTITLEQATRTGVILGTAGYMAPEQARGRPVDKRADIWSFGVVVYEMLTGERLFRGDTVSDTLAAVLTREPDWNRLPAQIRPMLRRCLERDPKQRLRDIGDALYLLDERPPAAAPRSGPRWLTAAGLLILGAGLALLPWHLLTPRLSEPSILRLSVDLGDEAALMPRRMSSLTISPDGSRLVFIAGEAITNPHLAVRRLDQSKATALPGTQGAEAPFFSPDGKSVAFFAEGKLKRVDTAGGAPIALCDAPAPREGSWGDDDTIVFAPTNRGGLSRVPAAGGTPQPITRLEAGEETHRYPQMLPGSRAVLFANTPDGTGEGRIEACSLPSGKRKILVPMGGYARYLPGGFLIYMHHGTVFAVRMNAERLELTGSPVPMLEDVTFYPSSGAAAVAFSQTGMLVYVATGPDDQMRPIGVADEKGKMELLPVARARFSHPRVSPDGKRLAVTVAAGAATNVWIYDWDSQRLARFGFQKGNTKHAIWTPDGKYLAIFSDTQTPGPGIYCVRADGMGVPVRLVEGKGLVPQVFFARGTRLLYGLDGGPSSGLYTVALDWSQANGLKAGVGERVPGPAIEGPATFSPDERWLAYGGGEGTPEVFVRPFPGLGGPWQISAGGISPFWSRSGGELFYRGIPDYRIMVAKYVGAGDSFSPGQPRTWSEVRVDSYDLMPDGKRAVVIPAADQKDPTHVTFLLNFMDDLRRRVK